MAMSPGRDERQTPRAGTFVSHSLSSRKIGNLVLACTSTGSVTVQIYFMLRNLVVRTVTISGPVVP